MIGQTKNIKKNDNSGKMHHKRVVMVLFFYFPSARSEAIYKPSLKFSIHWKLKENYELKACHTSVIDLMHFISAAHKLPTY